MGLQKIVYVRATAAVAVASTVLGCARLEGLLPGEHSSSSIARLYLVDVDSGRDLIRIKDGGEIDLVRYQGKPLSIRADIKIPPPAQVLFDVNGRRRFRVESSPPYAIAGDVKGRYLPWKPRVGINSITIRVMKARSLVGQENFTLVVKNSKGGRPKAMTARDAPIPPTTEEVQSEAFQSNPGESVSPEASELDVTTDTTEGGTSGTESVGEEVAVLQPPMIPIPNFVLRLNCGGRALVDQEGKSWEPDDPFTQSSKFGTSPASTDPHVVNIFQTGRSSLRSPISYRIPLPNGTYRITFYFMELYVITEGKSVFDISAEGGLIATSLDVVQRAGAQRPYQESRIVTVTDGELSLDFTPQHGLAIINGLEIEQMAALNQVAADG